MKGGTSTCQRKGSKEGTPKEERAEECNLRAASPSLEFIAIPGTGIRLEFGPGFGSNLLLDGWGNVTGQSFDRTIAGDKVVEPASCVEL